MTQIGRGFFSPGPKEQSRIFWCRCKTGVVVVPGVGIGRNDKNTHLPQIANGALFFVLVYTALVLSMGDLFLLIDYDALIFVWFLDFAPFVS